MASYILLLTLTPEGRDRLMRDPDVVRQAEDAISLPQTYVLGKYGVLGQYDFVYIVEAPDNDAAARYSLELGVTAGVHVVTMPAIPLSRLQGRRDPGERIAMTEADLPSTAGQGGG